MEKDVKLKKSADGYILVVMGYLNIGHSLSNEILDSMIDSLNISVLNTKVQVIYPERYHYKFIETTPNNLHVEMSEDLGQDLETLRSTGNSLLLIRNDGTIVAKNIVSWFLTSTLSEPNFCNSH